jgi:hypothetical protein
MSNQTPTRRQHIQPLPQNGQRGLKFVQVYVLEDHLLIPYLFLSQEPGTEEDRHGNIFAAGLSTLGVEFPLATERHLRKRAYPARTAEAYRVAGMGKCNFEAGLLDAFGFSADYELRPSEEHFRDLQRYMRDFRFTINPDVMRKE